MSQWESSVTFMDSQSVSYSECAAEGRRLFVVAERLNEIRGVTSVDIDRCYHGGRYTAGVNCFSNVDGLREIRKTFGRWKISSKWMKDRNTVVLTLSLEMYPIHVRLEIKAPKRKSGAKCKVVRNVYRRSEYSLVCST